MRKSRSEVVSHMSVFRFRDFQYDSVERRLTRNGEWVELTPKAMDILEVFIGRPGELISRDEIIGKVWGGTLVEEGNLSVHISKLRKALGDSRDQRCLETVAGSGYRFTATIEQISNGHRPAHFTHDPIHTSNGNGFHPRDSEAARLLDKGKHFFENINPTTIHKAIECLERSLTFDPSNPETNAYMVRAYRLLHSFGIVSAEETLRKIDDPMRQMLNSDRPSDSALIAAGEVEMLLRGDLSLAESHFRKAL